MEGWRRWLAGIGAVAGYVLLSSILGFGTGGLLGPPEENPLKIYGEIWRASWVVWPIFTLGSAAIGVGSFIIAYRGNWLASPIVGLLTTWFLYGACISILFSTSGTDWATLASLVGGSVWDAFLFSGEFSILGIIFGGGSPAYIAGKVQERA